MSNAPQQQSHVLRNILSVIAPDLQQAEIADIRAFIDAGEHGLAADTIFCAISEDRIPVNDDLQRDLSSIAHLYNAFGDLDPETATNVLARSRRRAPSM